MPAEPANKILDLPRLAEAAENARRSGKTVALAHGTFDLLHFGHVRHLQAARNEGDVLIVTITSDSFVNKGPGRPVFPHGMRAEMLAALECVDYVGINNAATAENVLSLVRPNAYVKGADYADARDDVTGKIVDERAIVESYGGRVCFTNDVTFSSSALINRHLDLYDPDLRDFLNIQRREGGIEVYAELIERVKNYKVLIVGDTIIDEYHYVVPLGRSPKENMIASLYKDRELFAGGVVAAANHVAGLCGEVEILTALGGADSREDLVRNTLQPNVRLTAIDRRGMPTTRKRRFVDQGYLRKLFEVYHMDDSPLSAEEEDTFVGMVAERAAAADLVIVTDFGHGLITPKVIRALIDNARFLAVNAQTNSANTGFNLITRYPRADFVCLDAPEARLAVMDKFADVERIAQDLLSARMHCERMIITNGRYGCVTRGPAEAVTRIPAFTRTVVDTVGAGDAFFAVAAPLVAAGGSVAKAGVIGNVAGALKVGIVGHRRSVEKPAILKYLHTLLS